MNSTTQIRPMAERLLTLREAAEVLGIEQRTIRGWIAAGRLPVVRLSPRCLRVSPGDLAALIASRRTA